MALSAFPRRRILIIKALGQLAAVSALRSPSLQHCAHKCCSLITIINIKNTRSVPVLITFHMSRLLKPQCKKKNVCLIQLLVYYNFWVCCFMDFLNPVLNVTHWYSQQTAFSGTILSKVRSEKVARLLYILISFSVCRASMRIPISDNCTALFYLEVCF